MNERQVKEYVEKVYILESTKYEQELLINKINKKINQVNSIKLKPIKSTDSTGQIFINSVIGAGVCAFFAWLFLYITVMFGLFELSTIVKMAIGAGVILFILFFWACISSREEDIRDNQNIAKENEQLNRNKKVMYEYLMENQESTKSVYENTERILKQYYDRNILFPKYRNLIAVSSIYEYLQSGRCSTLEGYEGAYNIFENELRLNLIVTKLDDIIYRLDSIRDNQYMLYDAINRGNHTSEKLFQSLEKIGDNSAVSAYNSSINAQNTEFLKWVEFLR